ncbi:hypothetical protein COCCADRAFT_112214, partial [Bipolaris zeicola 26-R-13]
GQPHARITTNTTHPIVPQPPQIEPINAALEAIAALEPGEKLVYAQIARKFGVEPSTLRRRHQGLTTSREAYY